MRIFLLFAVLSLSQYVEAQVKVDQEYVGVQILQGNPYTLVLLKPTGQLPSNDSISSWQMGHLINLFQMHVDMKTSVFGPVTDPKADIGGIIIFNTSDTTKVKTLMAQDPFIKGNVFTYKMYPMFSIPGQKLLESEKTVQ